METKNSLQVNRLEKEKQDYLFCLEAASKLSPREGVLLVEDDSLPGITLYLGFPLLNPLFSPVKGLSSTVSRTEVIRVDLIFKEGTF